MMGTTKKLRKVTKGNAVSRQTMHDAHPKGGTNGTRLAKVFAAMVKKHAK